MLGTALAGQSCTTVTDFSNAKLNQESPNLHVTTFMAHFENGALHLAGKINFELRPNMCLRSIQVAPTKEGSPMPIVTVQTFFKRYKVETTGKGVFTSDAEGKIDFGEDHCDVSSFSVEGNEAALKSVDYCTAQTAVGGNAKRSVQIRDVEGVATEGTKPSSRYPTALAVSAARTGTLTASECSHTSMATTLPLPSTRITPSLYLLLPHSLWHPPTIMPESKRPPLARQITAQDTNQNPLHCATL